MTTSRPHDERGSLSLEAALLTPVAVLVVLALTALGHIAHARLSVDAAAQDAARAASLASSRSTAARDARLAAAATLQGERISCASLRVTVDLSRYRPGGVVVATVACRPNLGALGLPGVRDRQVSARAVVPVDTYATGASR